MLVDDQSIYVDFPDYDKMVNHAFLPIFNNRDRYIFLWGGRDSSKSYSTAVKLVFEALTEKYFKCVLVRKVYDTVKESMYDLIKEVVNDYGLSELFTFKVQPLEIVCDNGNRFIARGLDKVEKIKSIKDPTKIWYEEGNQITWDDFVTCTTSVRSTNAEYLQEIITFNPESSKPDYKNFWIYKNFFEGYEAEMYGHFRGTRTLNFNNEEVTISYTCIHTTYKDNKYCTPERAAILESLKESDEYFYKVFTLGMWGNRDVGNRFWKSFNQSKHVGGVYIDEEAPLHISLDENVHPYISMTIWQIEGKEVRQVHEIFNSHPRNTVKDLINDFVQWVETNRLYRTVYIYGDRNSNKEDTKLEKGSNFFTIVESILNENFIKPILRLPSKNPPVAASGEFINAVYSSNFGGIDITIDEDCKVSINDYINTVEDSDGTIKKIRVKDKLSGVSYEPYGHASDTKRYFLCEAFLDEFNNYLRGGILSKVDRTIKTSNKRTY